MPRVDVNRREELVEWQSVTRLRLALAAPIGVLRRGGGHRRVQLADDFIGDGDEVATQPRARGVQRVLGRAARHGRRLGEPKRHQAGAELVAAEQAVAVLVKLDEHLPRPAEGALEQRESQRQPVDRDARRAVARVQRPERRRGGRGGRGGGRAPAAGAAEAGTVGELHLGGRTRRAAVRPLLAARLGAGRAEAEEEGAVQVQVPLLRQTTLPTAWVWVARPPQQAPRLRPRLAAAEPTFSMALISWCSRRLTVPMRRSGWARAPAAAAAPWWTARRESVRRSIAPLRSTDARMNDVHWPMAVPTGTAAARAQREAREEARSDL